MLLGEEGHEPVEEVRVGSHAQRLEGRKEVGELRKEDASTSKRGQTRERWRRLRMRMRSVGG